MSLEPQKVKCVSLEPQKVKCVSLEPLGGFIGHIREFGGIFSPA